MEVIMKRIITMLLCGIAACLIVVTGFWLVSIAKCEYCTIQYGKQFEKAYEEHTMLTEPDYLKVLAYSSTEAQIYYVTRGVGGAVLAFERNDEQCEWEFKGWIATWSSSGSADDFIWPYIR